MKNYLKKNKNEFIAFFGTFIILTIIFFMIGIFKKSIFISDLEVQMLPLFKQFILLLTGKAGMYNFTLGMGDYFLGTLYYYLLSPFNLLSLVIKDINILVILIILLKSSFSSLFSYKYLKYQFDNKNQSYLIVFSLLYGLSSYFISYNMFIQFFDVYMIFPLLLLGIDKIIKEKKYPLYVITLMFTIFSNYYFAYMVCIFAFLYFNYKILMNKIPLKKIIKENINFIFISFLSCLSMSFILLPVATEIGNYSRDSSELFGGENLKLLFNLKYFTTHHILGDFSKETLINMHVMYIYTSIITIPLIYFYFINNKINKREKVLTAIMFLILILSLGINYINYIWHGFTPPCAINGRYTFMFILFIIYICCKSIINIQQFNKKHFYIIFSSIYFIVFLYSFIYYPRLIDINVLISIFLVYMFIVLSSLILKKYNTIKTYLLIFLIIFISSSILLLTKVINISYFLKLLLLPLSVYMLHCLIKKRNIKLKHFIFIFITVLAFFSIYVMYSNRIILGKHTFIKLTIILLYLIILKFINKKHISKLLITLLVIELVINSHQYLYRYTYNWKYDKSYEEAINYIKKQEDSLFYRIEDNYNESLMNNSQLYNYYGIDYFMSTINKSLVKFFNDLDVVAPLAGKNTISYDGSYHLLSSLLNVKYYIENHNLENDLYTQIKDIDNYVIYKNEQSLNLGYMVNKDLIKLKKKSNGLEYINDIYKTMTNNQNNILDKIDITKKNENTYTFNNTKRNDFYILINLDRNKYNPLTEIDKRVSNINLKINNESLEDTSNGIFIYKVNNAYDKNKPLEITFDKKLIPYVLDVFVYYYNEKVYKEDIDILKQNQLIVTNINNDGIEGTIDVQDEGLLFTSIVYNDNLDVYVDGIKQKKVKLLDTFTGVNLDKGKHKIVFKYNNKILYISLIPSLVGVSMLLILYLKSKKRK